jgi:hypothetical protein
VELRNILKGFNLDSITASNINDIGKAVFADKRAKGDLNDLNDIMSAWRMVHVPTHGNPIPQTSSINTATSVADTHVSLLSPSANQVERVLGFWIHNGTLGNITIQYFYAAKSVPDPFLPLCDVTTVAAGDTVFIPPYQGIVPYADSNYTIYGKSNTDSLSMGAITNKISQ